MTPESWLSRHPLFCYFALCFGIGWGGVVIVIAATGFRLATLRPLEMGLIFMLMLLGPSASGLILTAALNGRAAENLGPFAEAQVRRDHDAGALVNLALQMEEQGAAGSAERQVAKFVQDTRSSQSSLAPFPSSRISARNGG